MRSRWRTRPGASWAVSRSGSKGTPPIRPGVRSAGLRPASTAERRSQPQPPPAHSGHRRGTSRPVNGTTAWNAGLQTGTRCAGVRSAGLRPASTAERRSKRQPPPAHSGHRRGTSRPVDGTTAWNAGFSRHPLGESPAESDNPTLLHTPPGTGTPVFVAERIHPIH